MSEAKERINTRIYTNIGGNTFESFKGITPKSFIKVTFPDTKSHRDPLIQFNSYQKLKRYLHMPKVHLISGSEGLPELIIQRVVGERFDISMKENPERFIAATNCLIDDLDKMWKETQKPMEEKELVVDLRRATIETIEAVKADNKMAQLIDLPLIINGTKYPSLGEVSDTCLEKLRANVDPVMVLGHGDEHIQNLFSQNKKGGVDYKLIDPRIAGYYSPAYAVNKFIGTPLLVMFSYQFDQQVSTTWNIQYKIDDDNREAWNALITCGRDMITRLQKLNRNGFLLREYLFGNLIRSAIDRVKPKIVQSTHLHAPVHIAAAIQIYLDLDQFLAE